MINIGLITIGQSPRYDIILDFKENLPNNIYFDETGLLDNFSEDFIIHNLSPNKNETLYVTRLRNGKEVYVSKEKLINLLQNKIEEFQFKNLNVIVILCSGEFPEFESNIFLIYPDKIMKNILTSFDFSKLAVLIPSDQQINYAKERWKRYANDVIIFDISPYTSHDENFVYIGKKLQNEGIECVVMDCIGYTLKQKYIIRKVMGETIPIINTRSIIINVIKELFY
jgi:protein AroM